MKRTVAAAAISLAISAAAGGAANALPLWQGDMYITAISGCAGTGNSIGDFGQAIFSPLASNGVTDRLALFSPRGSASQFMPSSGTTLNGATSFTVTQLSHAGTAAQYTNLAEGAFTVSPAAPTASNKTLNITAPLVNFAGVAGCNVTMHGVLYLVP
jgi:hypothetical protein